MTKQEQQELMEIMREQQRIASAECLAKAELTQGSAIEPQKLTDEEAVDLLMHQANDIRTAPRLAYAAWMSARMHVIRLRARAEQIGGMRLSHDKVTGGQPLMMEDQVSAILEAEETVKHLWLVYLAARGSFLYCLDRAARIRGFTAYQCKLWKMYYLGEGHNLQEIADMMHETKDRIYYLITHVKAQTAWCQAVEYVIENEAEFELEVG